MTVRKGSHRDWLVLESWRVLHHVRDWPAGENWMHAEATATCGVHGDFSLPGLVSRMGLPRCAHCCDRLGIPRGNGNTLNAGIRLPVAAAGGGQAATGNE